VKPLSPEDARKLGLDVVLQRLQDHLVGERSVSVLNGLKPFSQLAALNAELDRVSQMQECLQFDDAFQLGDIPVLEPILSQLGPIGLALEGMDLLTLARVARASEETAGYFTNRRETYPGIATLFVDLPEETLPWRNVEKSLDEKGDIRDGASPTLSRIRKQLASARSSAREAAFSALKKASASGFATDEQPTIRGGRMVIPVRAEAKRKVSGFVHDVSASGQTVYIEPAASLEANNRVRELELEDIRECHAIRVKLSDPFRTARRHLETAVTCLTAVDVLRAKARLAIELEAIVPEVKDEGHIVVNQARNPELSLVFRRDHPGRAVVPFDLSLGTSDTMMVISGPNAGGKSVTMKAVGLMAAMIALGLPIPVGEKSRFDLFSGVFLDIGDEQSMSDDLSTYTSHLRNMTRILEGADENCLVLIDEAGTGTDPEAGGATAQAILEELHRRQVRTVVTTHYGPLKLFAHDTDGVQNASMMFDQDKLEPTYVFAPGIPGSSYAREIAARSGIPEAIIDRSTELVDSGQASAEALIQDLMGRNTSLQDALEKAEITRKALQKREKQLQERLDNIQEESDQIRGKALASADQIMKEANRAVEKTIREIKESAADPVRTKEARKRLESTKQKVEKTAQNVEAKRKKRKKKQPSAPVATEASGPIQVGDQVRMEDGQTVGEVMELSGKRAVVAFDSLQMKTELSRLVKVGRRPKQQVRVRQAATSGGRLNVSSVATRLDIRGRRADEALSEIVPFVDRAMAAGVARVEVVHGKGTGALRTVLHEYLATLDGIRDFGEAPITEGGAGATHIRFAD